MSRSRPTCSRDGSPEAERERRAKIINAEGEFQASEKLAGAADVLSRNPVALQLRYLQVSERARRIPAGAAKACSMPTAHGSALIPESRSPVDVRQLDWRAALLSLKRERSVPVLHSASGRGGAWAKSLRRSREVPWRPMMSPRRATPARTSQTPIAATTRS